MTLRWMRNTDEFTRVAAVRSPGWLKVFDEKLNVTRYKSNGGKPAVIELEPETVLHDWVYASAMFVVSQPLKRLLEEYEVHADYIPVQILQQGKECIETPYSCCNLLAAVDCFDFNAGTCTLDSTGDIEKIEVFRIDESKAAPYHLFRLGHGKSRIVLVSNDVANAIQEHQLTGMAFMTIESWPQI